MPSPLLSYYVQQQKRDEIRECKFHELPIDILISILRHLEFKEATRTSILSKNHTSLDIDVFFNEATEKQFLDSINRVLKLYRASSIDGFRVCFGLNNTNADDINKWVEFAILKGVKTLELDFSSKRKNCVNYSLPSSILMLPSCERQLKLLTSLCLKLVNVNAEFIELLLSRCKLLERLHIEDSYQSIGNLKITSQSLKILVLKVGDIWSMMGGVEIDAFNLVSLVFRGWQDVVYANVPKLVEASFEGDYVESFNIFPSINLVSSQLSKLSFDVEQYKWHWNSLPTFENVKDLAVKVKIIISSRHLINLRRFFEACPSLETAKLETNCWSCCREKRRQYGIAAIETDYYSEFKDNMDLNKAEEGSIMTMLPNLRRVDWCGEFSIPLASHIIKISNNNLVKFVYDPHSPSCYDSSCYCAGWEDISRDDIARYFTKRVHNYVDLVIL